MITTADSRGRLTVGKRGTTYKLTKFDGDSLLLEPAEVLTKAELVLLVDPKLRESVTDSMNHPTRRRSRKA